MELFDILKGEYEKASKGYESGSKGILQDEREILEYLR
jgi:hypothetical protein